MKRTSNRQGFSLLELMVSLAIMMVVSGSAFYAMVSYQKTYRSSMLTEEMRSSLRAAVVLMTQEIGQAGLLTFPSRTLIAPITTKGVQTVTVSSTANMFLGQKLSIDVGTSQEVVTVTDLSPTAITASFTLTHAAGALVDGAGSFPTGILTTAPGSTLELYGDMNGDGNIHFVQYTCDLTAGVLTRSSTNIAGTTSKSAADTLVDHLVANPDNAPCFHPTIVTVGGKQYVSNVGITVSMRSVAPDPFSGKYSTMTQSFMNLSPRNVLAALDLLAQSPSPFRVQPKPPNLPLT